MTLHRVNKVEAVLSKDTDTGILTLTSAYRTNTIKHAIAFILNYNVITPDTFEISVQDNLPIEATINSIATEVTNLSLTDRNLPNVCPICSEATININGRIICLNVDCRVGSDVFGDIARKLRIILPNASDQSIMYWISQISATMPITVSNIIKYITNMYIEGSITPLYIPETSALIDAIQGMTITKLFRVCTILDVSDEFDMLVVSFDDSLLALINDVNNNNSHMLALSLDPNLVSVTTTLLRSNIYFLETISLIMGKYIIHERRAI